MPDVLQKSKLSGRNFHFFNTVMHWLFDISLTLCNYFLTWFANTLWIQYEDYIFLVLGPHYKGMAVVRPSCPYNGNYYNVTTTSLCRTRGLGSVCNTVRRISADGSTAFDENLEHQLNILDRKQDFIDFKNILLKSCIIFTVSFSTKYTI